MKRNISFLLAIASAFAFCVLGACGSDDSSSFNEDDDTGLEEMSSGSNGNSEDISSSSSSSDKLNPSEKIKPSIADSNGTFVDSRDSTVYGTLRQGPYIWMTRNMSNNVYGTYSFCYDRDDRNCERYGRLYVANSGNNVCPGKFRLPTRTEWKEGKKSLSLGLQYGGTCK